jgi:hypothetical protein
MGILRSSLLTFAVALGSVAPALAQTTWHVDASAPPPGSGTPSAPYASLQFAIAQPTTVDGDTVLAAPGIYGETVRFLGKRLVVRSSGGSDVTVIDALGAPQAVRFVDGEPQGARIQGFTIRGASNPSRPEVIGGGVSCVGGRAEIRDCVIEQCGDLWDFYLGAGIGVANGADVRVVRTVVRQTETNVAGGGLYVSTANAIVEDSQFSGCRTILWGQGGAVSAQSATLSLARTVLELSSSGSGGGLWATDSILRLDTCLVSQCYENTGMGSGGGLSATGGSLDISRSVFERCSAAVGGAIHAAAAFTLRDSLLLDNAAEHAGALHVFNTTANIERTDFVGNSGWFSSSGAALHIHWNASASFDACRFSANRRHSHPGDVFRAEGGAHFRNCEFWGNLLGEQGSLIRGASLERCTFARNEPAPSFPGAVALVAADSSLKDCVVWDNPSCTQDLPTCTLTYCNVEFAVAGASNFSSPPLLRDTPNGDLRLLAGSPCIDAGDPLSAPDLDGTRADVGAHSFYNDYGDAPLRHCSAKISGAGCAAYLRVGSAPPSVSSGLFEIVLENVPPARSTRMLWGVAAQSVPFKGGLLCVAQPTRSPEAISAAVEGLLGCGGRAHFVWRDLTGALALLSAGDTVHVQFVYRDTPSSFGLAFSDALTISLVP